MKFKRQKEESAHAVPSKHHYFSIGDFISCLLFLIHNIIDDHITWYREAYVWRIIDGFEVIGELIDSLDPRYIYGYGLTTLAVRVMSLDGSQLAHILAPTVIVLHPGRSAVVERTLELGRSHENVVGDLVDDCPTTTKFGLRFERVNCKVYLSRTDTV